MLLLEKLYWGSKEVVLCISLDRDLFHNWIAEAETKVVCRAKNKNDLLKAEELGWEENKDYWLIYDACRTELEREGPEGTLTCIGFRPMEAEEIEVNIVLRQPTISIIYAQSVENTKQKIILYII